MKSYPSIKKKIKDISIYAFDKLDGSNLRASFSQKKGWHKFGTRRMVIDKSNEDFGEGIDLILEKYSNDLESVFRDCFKKNNEWKREIVCFFEYYGSQSFAGYHDENEKKTVTLLDVSPHKEGILLPGLFLDLFGHLDIPKVLYRGYPEENFIRSVQDGTLEGMSFEGVVCKGANYHKKTKKPVMFKIKNQKWIERLKNHCDGNDKLFEDLA